jgi:DNA (cytosine-5)-methyltransferase 1
VARPRLLDLFCGAGGASTGYWRAGFDVEGVDNAHLPSYPYDYTCASWDEFSFDGFDVIHASPPCQAYSAMSACRPGHDYPDLIAPVREALEAWGGPYVIENVVGAPLKDPVMLCGLMFDRPLHRHRLFESNVPLTVPDHPVHTVPTSRAGHWTPGTIMSVAGHVAPIAHARAIMGIDWCPREELVEAIPPYYAEHIGRQVLACL